MNRDTVLPRQRRVAKLASPPFVLALAYALLSTAWVMGNPPGAAPDESAHYRKALAVAAGEPEGRRAVVPPSPSDTQQSAWLKRTASAVEVPAGLSPQGLECHAQKAEESARCQNAVQPVDRPMIELTHMGRAHPTAYLLPGLLARMGDGPFAAMRLGRAGNLLTSLLLLCAAIALLWDTRIGRLSIVGLLPAVTPMALFLAASLTPSGPEVASGICFLSALLRLTRRDSASTWAWVALGLSGTLLATSRSLGPIWVVLAVVMVVTSSGVKHSWLVCRTAGKRSVWSLGAVALAVVLSVTWAAVVEPGMSVTRAAIRGAVLPSWQDIPSVFRQVIGTFGALETWMPEIAYKLWWSAGGALCVLALLLGSWRDRAVLVMVGAGSLGMTMLVSVVNMAVSGYGMQGRYVLPLLVAVPLLAGETVVRRRHRLPGMAQELLVAGLLVVAGTLNALGWYANARRSSIGIDGSWLFVTRSEWSPPGGWYPWLAMVGMATSVLMLHALQSVLARESHAYRRPLLATDEVPVGRAGRRRRRTLPA
ncbi:MAG: DUF2142 domain-containing protein [Actinomycetota bacterium]|nr:DUF2142 domain-containing protein [Actinomycetota bacterium]